MKTTKFFAVLLMGLVLSFSNAFAAKTYESKGKDIVVRTVDYNGEAVEFYMLEFNNSIEFFYVETGWIAAHFDKSLDHPTLPEGMEYAPFFNNETNSWELYAQEYNKRQESLTFFYPRHIYDELPFWVTYLAPGK